MATSSDFTLSVPAVTAGADATVTLSRPNRQYGAAFTVTFAGVREALPVTVLSESDTRVVYSWRAPLSWCESLPNALSGSGTIAAQISFDSTIDALDDPNVCTVSVPFTLYVPESLRPTASLTVEVVNDNAVAAGWGLALRDMSRLRYTVSAEGTMGATVKECTFSWGGQSMTGFDGTTPPLSAAGTVVPTARVTDSRGRSVEVRGKAITVWDYRLPSLSGVSVLRCTQNGTADSAGAYLKVCASASCAAVDGRNSVKLRVRTRVVGGTWGNYVNLVSGEAKVLAASAEAVYEAEFSAVDTLGSQRTVVAVSGTAAVAFHLREGGLGAAFGKRATSDGLHCAWNADFDGNVTVAGKVSAASLTVAGKSLLDLVYPVGAVYMSLKSTSPATLFGGTWTAINGKFLLATDSTHAVNTTGGSATHTLTTAQMPSHTHRVQGYVDAENVGHDHSIPNIRTGQSGEYGAYTETWGYGSGSRDLYTDHTDITHNHRVDITSQSTGSGTSFSLMPPYLAVYMWRRTA